MNRYEEQPYIVGYGSRMGPTANFVLAELLDLGPGLYKVRVKTLVSAGDATDSNNIQLKKHDTVVTLVPFDGTESTPGELELNLELTAEENKFQLEVIEDRGEQPCLYSAILMLEKVR